jgi:small subunit ribosomal protein S7
MSRRGRAEKREPPPDSRFSSLMIAKLINRMMKSGKKRTAEGIVYTALDIIEEQEKKDPVLVLEQAIKNVTPQIQVKPRRVAGATYQVPTEIKGERGAMLAFKWLLAAAQTRRDRSMAEKLAGEVMDAAQGQGAAIKKREELHKIAQANRAFVHFRY